MGNRVFTRVHLLLATAAIAVTALLAPAAASAATVVNGDFEAGSLAGWQLVNDPTGPPPTGTWVAYTGTVLPGGTEPTVPPPPAGTFAAITRQEGPGTHILYQDVALEPFYFHQLSLLAYYRSPIGEMATPSPNSLLTGGGPDPANQQYRIDVVKPTAPIFSLEPSDILATVFATSTGYPQELGPTAFTADLTPFAGQTVRLRFAEADNRGNLFAGTDAVAIASTPPPNGVLLRKPILNKKKGTAKLPVTVPGAGTLKIADAKAKGKKRVQGKTLQATASKTLRLPVKPTKFGRNALVQKGKLTIKVAVTFTPLGGFAATETKKFTLELTPPKK